MEKNFEITLLCTLYDTSKIQSSRLVIAILSASLPYLLIAFISFSISALIQQNGKACSCSWELIWKIMSEIFESCPIYLPMSSTVLIMVLSTVIRTVILSSNTLVLILKYDRCRISTGDLVCLYSGPLTSLSKVEVFLCFYLTQSRMHSHIWPIFHL